MAVTGGSYPVGGGAIGSSPAAVWAAAISSAAPCRLSRTVAGSTAHDCSSAGTSLSSAAASARRSVLAVPVASSSAIAVAASVAVASNRASTVQTARSVTVAT